MTRHGMACVAMLLTAAMTAAAAEQGGNTEHADLDHGRKIYQYWCSSCHGPGDKGMFGTGLPGTLALRVKYRGKEPPVLEDRTDLDPQTVRYVVRHGIQAMPFFRKTEVSDADLNAIAAYLARNNP